MAEIRETGLPCARCTEAVKNYSIEIGAAIQCHTGTME